MMTPRWWVEYVGGRLSAPSDLYLAARSEAFASSDGPDTWFQRFAGEPVDCSLGPTPRLRWPSGFGTDTWLKQQAQADWASIDVDMRRFCGAVLKFGAAVQIPLYVSVATPWEVQFLHCRYGSLLLPDEWQVIGWLCQRAVVDSPLRLVVCDQGVVSRPDAFGPFPVRDRLSLTPSRLVL